MKITEIKWIDGKRYEANGAVWEVCDGELTFDNCGHLIFDNYSLKEIAELDFVEVINWDEVKVDTKILVRQTSGKWMNRYFYKYENGKVYYFQMGATSFTTEYYADAWGEVKLYEEE